MVNLRMEKGVIMNNLVQILGAAEQLNIGF
jgi:hypothetical protein